MEQVVSLYLHFLGVKNTGACGTFSGACGGLL